MNTRWVCGYPLIYLILFKVFYVTYSSSGLHIQPKPWCFMSGVRSQCIRWSSKPRRHAMSYHSLYMLTFWQETHLKIYFTVAIRPVYMQHLISWRGHWRGSDSMEAKFASHSNIFLSHFCLTDTLRSTHFCGEEGWRKRLRNNIYLQIF